MFFPPIYSVLLGKQFTAVCYDVVCYIGRYTCTLGSIRYTPSKLGPVVQNKVHESLIEKKPIYVKQKYCIPVDDILDKYMFIYYSLSINECEPNFFLKSEINNFEKTTANPVNFGATHTQTVSDRLSSVSVEYFQAKVIKLYLSIIYY